MKEIILSILNKKRDFINEDTSFDKISDEINEAVEAKIIQAQIDAITPYTYWNDEVADDAKKTIENLKKQLNKI